MNKNQFLFLVILSLFVSKVVAQPCSLQAAASKTLTNNIINISNLSSGTTIATTFTWTFHSGDIIYSAPISYTTNAINPAPYTYTANGRSSILLSASNNPTCVSTTTVWVDVCHFSPTLNYTQNPGGVLTFTTQSEGIYLQQEKMSYGDGTQDFHYPGTPAWNSPYTHTYFNGTYTPSTVVDYGHGFCFVTTTVL